jgi:hypothetical protein
MNQVVLNNNNGTLIELNNLLNVYLSCYNINEIFGFRISGISANSISILLIHVYDVPTVIIILMIIIINNNYNGALCRRLNICYARGRLFENFVTDLRSFAARKSIRNRRRSR